MPNKMPNKSFSWGALPFSGPQQQLVSVDDFSLEKERSFLPYGNGMSYGDSCLSASGTLLDFRSLDNFISFNSQTGLLKCQAGVLLSEILRVFVPKGWFLPVTPGTKYVTVAGAIANDVHGKNHHFSGNFGHHVQSFELERSDGSCLICSPTQNSDWFAATIGGLGLTGMITWAEIQLKPINSTSIDVKNIRFENLKEFFEISTKVDKDYEYTVAWIDCLAKGESMGRGIFMLGNHVKEQDELKTRELKTRELKTRELKTHSSRRISVPIKSPFSLVNRLTLPVMTNVYYRKPIKAQEIKHYNAYFYPLDAISSWNKVYGPKGFFQYQSVIPMDVSYEATKEMLTEIAKQGTGSFLAVLKVFGDIENRGLMSFPQKGTTLALDFPNNGAVSERLFKRLDAIVASAGGRLYAAKDARMPAQFFKDSYTNWEKLETMRDPAILSSFWKRVVF